MATKTFVSFNFTDRERVRTMHNFFQKHQAAIQGSPVFCDNDVSAAGVEAIDKEIRRVMRDCDAALFVIGDDTHNSPWIGREAQIAISKELPIVITQLSQLHRGEPPELGSRLVVARVEWDPNAIGQALNKVGRTK